MPKIANDRLNVKLTKGNLRNAALHPGRSRLVVGLMSGTSLDGIDAVLLRVKGDGASTSFRQLAFCHLVFPRGLRELLVKNSDPSSSRVDEIARLNTLLAHLYSDAVRSVVRKAGKKLTEVELIGSHGQTIQHLPRPVRMFGRNIRTTLQIGDPSALATLTGITTVGDFRLADMAAGGQGAPLVPYVDWLLFHSKARNRILLNIGGIANFTVLPWNCGPDKVIAFDTGPGNMIVDAMMQRLYQRPYDRGGATACKGLVILELFDWLKQHPYLKRPPPKSTGREEFGEKLVSELLVRARHYDREDIVATAAQFTAFAVFDGYRRFVGRRQAIDELIVSGGGMKNRYIMGALENYFRQTRVKAIDELGISSEAKEAICFAILANECLAGNPANMPSVTGAKRRVVLGKICRA